VEAATGMRLSRLTGRLPILLAAFVLNGLLFLTVPVLQALLHAPATTGKPKEARVEREVLLTPPERPRAPEREIREIRLQPAAQAVTPEARPSLPGGGLAIDLSPVGGEGSMALVSGGDRTGPLGSGTGGGTGSGTGNLVYEPGQTDADARISGQDQPPRYPPRAEREGVTGYVDVLFVVSEAGLPTGIVVIKEEPQGYGFAASAVEAVRKLRFQPATLNKVPVKQQLRRRLSFEP
jgi:TonB family protein